MSQLLQHWAVVYFRWLCVPPWRVLRVEVALTFLAILWVWSEEWLPVPVTVPMLLPACTVTWIVGIWIFAPLKSGTVAYFRKATLFKGAVVSWVDPHLPACLDWKYPWWAFLGTRKEGSKFLWHACCRTRRYVPKRQVWWLFLGPGILRSQLLGVACLLCVLMSSWPQKLGNAFHLQHDWTIIPNFSFRK